MDIIIETKRLFIRELKPGDIDSLLKIYQDPLNVKFIPNLNFNLNEDSLKEKYDRINKDYRNGFGIYAVEIKDENIIIGEAGLFNSFQDIKHLELGYIIDNKYWRKGYGTEICESLIAYGFVTLNLDKLTARMFKLNTASAHLSEKCGMKRIKQGKTDKGEGFYEYGIEKSDYKE